MTKLIWRLRCAGYIHRHSHYTWTYGWYLATCYVDSHAKWKSIKPEFAGKAIVEGWDESEVLHKTPMEMMKCQSCENGYDGKGGNGYQPCSCNRGEE